MVFKCPDGHDSIASDFCSDCGLLIPARATGDQGGVANLAASTQPAPRESCPRCRTDRDDPQSAFCGVCGYNFATRQSGDVVPKAAAVVRSPAKPSAPAPAPPRSVSKEPHIEIEITFDESNVEAPRGRPPRKFSLYEEESLIGRRSSSAAQTVGLEGDEGVSRRHLLIIRQPDGSYVVRLFDNTNGCTHNGSEMTAGVEVPLAEGDELAMGVFTVIRVSAIR